MQIKYTGNAGRREIAIPTGDPEVEVVYRWSRGGVTDVDTEALALELLTYPDGTFEIAPEDPLAKLVGMEAAGLLAGAGIISPAALKAVKRGDVKTLAAHTGIAVATLHKYTGGVKPSPAADKPAAAN